MIPVIGKYLDRGLDLRVRLFNGLALTGIPVGILVGTINLLTGGGPVSAAVSYAASVLAVALLRYSWRTGRYRTCYAITIAVLFLLFFPAMFFAAGGYRSGMPSFFVFAVVFTIFMLDPPGVFFATAFEIAVYIGLCVIAWLRPETVSFFDTTGGEVADVVTGFVVTSVALGIAMYLQIDSYRENQRLLAEKNAALEQFDRMKTEFLGEISHELRTPLSVMSGYAQLTGWQIKEGAVDGGTLDNLAVVSREAERLALLVERLLEISARKAEIDRRRRCDLADVLREAAALCAPILEKGGNRIRVEADGSLSAHAAPDAILQVLINLVTNAGRHTPSGTIALSAARCEDEIVVCVADDGEGVPLALLPHVFERGASGDGRSGLGLYLCRETIEAHGGTIRLENNEADGATATFTLPEAEG